MSVGVLFIHFSKSATTCHNKARIMADLYFQITNHQSYCILGNFASLNFCENGDFNNFTKNIFVNDPRGQHKRRGMAIFYFAAEQNSQNL